MALEDLFGRLDLHDLAVLNDVVGFLELVVGLLGCDVLPAHHIVALLAVDVLDGIVATDEVLRNHRAFDHVLHVRCEQRLARLALVVGPDDVQVGVAKLQEARFAATLGLSVFVEVFDELSAH